MEATVRSPAGTADDWSDGGSASAQVFPTNIQTSNVRSYPKTISLSATNLYQFRPLPPIKPEVFLDKDQVDLRFSKYSSYVQYGGRIYLAFGWILDTLGVPNAGSPDRVSLLIPWEIKTPSQEIHLFEEDNPDVYVKVYMGDDGAIKIIKDGDGFPLIEKKIKDKKTGRAIIVLFKRVQISVPENDVTSAEIYIGMTPKPKFVNATIPIVMGVHSYMGLGSFCVCTNRHCGRGHCITNFGTGSRCTGKNRIQCFHLYHSI
ncbi:hypothetical protein X802_05295 [Thermococcus guaymasensis DSM 11113]|uniref:Uncharacterized protein n=1 Tax=Thermococcus guaymasensis DSM 11113 TaxID=1432656 RepID=A0A0X1KNA9_9EURY|nr:hypothetical protein [Thermococcus guaymasensis]AJC72716.1 hypothetical protein X802_05295 [Thermococcus guaymasensis DSM 11113]